MDRETLLGQLPAYALDALDPDERAEVEAWLTVDAEARHLLDEYCAAAEQLSLALPARPAPPGLTDDLRRRLAERRTPTAAPSALPERKAGRNRRFGALPIRTLALAAGLMLIVGAALLWAARPGSPPDPAQQYAALAALKDALRLPIVPVETQPDVGGDLVASPDGTQAVIRVWGLPDLGADQTFQLWMIEEDGIEDGGLFRLDPGAPVAYIPVPLADRPLGAYRALGVSIEPAGGSPLPEGPSGPRVFQVPTDL